MHSHHFPSFSTVRRWALVGALTGVTTVAMAQATTPAAPAPQASPAAKAVSQGPQLTIRQIYDRVEAAGYRAQREIEWSDGRYEVKASNAQGERVKLEVDGNTGAVLRSRIKR